MNKQLQSQLIAKNQLLITIPHQLMLASKLLLPQNDNISSLAIHSNKAFMNMEAKFTALKGYIDREISF